MGDLVEFMRLLVSGLKIRHCVTLRTTPEGVQVARFLWVIIINAKILLSAHYQHIGIYAKMSPGGFM